MKQALSDAQKEIRGFTVSIKKEGGMNRFLIKFDDASLKSGQYSTTLYNLQTFLNRKFGQEIYIAPNLEREK